MNINDINDLESVEQKVYNLGIQLCIWNGAEYHVDFGSYQLKDQDSADTYITIFRKIDVRTNNQMVTKEIELINYVLEMVANKKGLQQYIINDLERIYRKLKRT